MDASKLEGKRILDTLVMGRAEEERKDRTKGRKKKGRSINVVPFNAPSHRYPSVEDD